MIKCKVSPIYSKLITREPTLSISKCRWLNKVPLAFTEYIDGTYYLTVVLSIDDDQDKSLSTLGCFRDKSIERLCMSRTGDNRVYKFQTRKGYQVLDESGDETSIAPEDLITIRFTPLVKDHRAYFALEAVIKHSTTPT